MIWLMGQGIRYTEIPTQNVLKGEIKFGKIKQPSGLLPIQVVRLMEVGQVFVVCKNLDSSRGTKKVVSPSI